jgi:hypothetical protein
MEKEDSNQVKAVFFASIKNLNHTIIDAEALQHPGRYGWRLLSEPRRRKVLNPGTVTSQAAQG